MGDREVTLRLSMRSEEVTNPATMASMRLARIAREMDRRIGLVTRLALAGDWLVAVAARDAIADTERLGQVMPLMQRTTMLAAHGKNADAIDAARSALACCPQVPELAADVERIVAILEAT